MAAFGKQDYGNPFGALAPSGFFDAQGVGFYDYSGFSSREGFFGFSGQSGFFGFSAFCPGLSGFSGQGLEFFPWGPTLVFPRRYEVIDGKISIIWERALPPDVCGSDVTFDVQFTRTFSRGTGWRTLAADLPSTQTSMDFDVSEVPFTEDGGIRIRAKNRVNLFSTWSMNIEPFVIKNHAPNAPTLLSPLGRETFDNAILVIWREARIKDLDGHPVTYKVQVSSISSKDEGWVDVPGGEALEQGTSSFTINSFEFPEGDDYGIRLFAIDEQGAGSAPQRAVGIKVRHNGNFIIDTIAPEGNLIINDGAALAKNTRVKLTLFAKDLSTGIKDIRFRNADEDCWGDWDTYVPEKFWDLSSTDGVKRVLVQYRDFAGNVSEACDCEIISRVLCDKGNVTDIEVFNNKLYAAFDADGNVVEYRVVVRTAATLPEPEVTALAKLGNALYIATFDPDVPTSGLYRYDGTATKIASGSVKVLSMASYNDKVYLGLQDGRIVQLSGTSLSTSYSAPSAVSRLRTDGSVLFAALASGGAYLTFDGTTWQSNSV